MKRDSFMRRSRMTGCGLTVGDIQDVAVIEIGRKLTKDELQKVEDPIGDYLAHTSWYDAILFGIQSLDTSITKVTETNVGSGRRNAG